MMAVAQNVDSRPLDSYEAWLFDLDGVITDTASVHAQAWKQMFDEFLQSRDANFQEFTIEGDYHATVDGKPRYDGVASFLKSRNIELPQGTPEDAPDAQTICGLGNRKNVLFNQVLQDEGATVFTSTVKLIETLKAMGKKIAIVTSSKNCNAVLKSAGLEDLTDTRVDGNMAAEKKLAGKPQPETYLEGARLLGAPAADCVVVEDALSGVEAGRNGHFGFVLGVDRNNEAEKLYEHGADMVVQDLGEIVL